MVSRREFLRLATPPATPGRTGLARLGSRENSLRHRSLWHRSAGAAEPVWHPRDGAPGGRHASAAGAELTVSVNVHGARVALAVVVRVDLRRVVHIRAVVTAVPDFIFVIVELAGVEEKLAVVLRKGKGRGRDTARTSDAARTSLGCTSLTPGGSDDPRGAGRPPPRAFLPSDRFPIIYASAAEMQRFRGRDDVTVYVTLRTGLPASRERVSEASVGQERAASSVPSVNGSHLGDSLPAGFSKGKHIPHGGDSGAPPGTHRRAGGPPHADAHGQSRWPVTARCTRPAPCQGWVARAGSQIPPSAGPPRDKALLPATPTFSSSTPSLSSSSSQASPVPSLSKSSCPEFGSRGQLSCNQRAHTSHDNTRGGVEGKPSGTELTVPGSRAVLSGGEARDTRVSPQGCPGDAAPPPVPRTPTATGEQKPEEREGLPLWKPGGGPNPQRPFTSRRQSPILHIRALRPPQPTGARSQA